MGEEYTNFNVIEVNNSSRIFLINNGEVVGTGSVSKIEFEEPPVADSYSDQEEDIKNKIKEYDIKERYPIPFYRERLNPKRLILRRKCRIRNRPNSGHGFK